MNRPTPQQRKEKVQELIDRMLYLSEIELGLFMNKFERLINEYEPQKIEVDGVKKFKIVY